MFAKGLVIKEDIDHVTARAANPPGVGVRGQRVLVPALVAEPERDIVGELDVAEEDGQFFVYSEAQAGKVKRIRNNPRVRLAPCDMRGGLKGEWVEATARILEGQEASHASELLDAKYGWQKRLLGFLTRFRPRPRAYLAIRLEP